MSHQHAVWKFNITAAMKSGTRKCDVTMPRNARVLSAALQRDELCLWALIDTEVEGSDKRRFACQMTGEEMDAEDAAAAKFITTIHLFNGDYVLHLFEDERGAA